MKAISDHLPRKRDRNQKTDPLRKGAKNTRIDCLEIIHIFSLIKLGVSGTSVSEKVPSLCREKWVNVPGKILREVVSIAQLGLVLPHVFSVMHAKNGNTGTAQKFARSKSSC